MPPEREPGTILPHLLVLAAVALALLPFLVLLERQRFDLAQIHGRLDALAGKQAELEKRLLQPVTREPGEP